LEVGDVSYHECPTRQYVGLFFYFFIFLFFIFCLFILIDNLIIGRQTVLFGATVSSESVGVSGIKSTALFLNTAEQLTNDECLQV